MCMKFRTFWKKLGLSLAYYYRNFCIGKRCLLKRLKGLAWKHHSVINVLTVSKHCWNQHGTPIFLFSHEFEINWVGKCLPKSYPKSSDCYLTRWLPMTSILVALYRISGNNFKRHYLKKKRLFQIFYCISEICIKFRTFWKKRGVSSHNYCRNYCILNRFLLKRLKGLPSEHHSLINVLTGSKHCGNKHGIPIFQFFHEFEINWVGKTLP